MNDDRMTRELPRATKTSIGQLELSESGEWRGYVLNQRRLGNRDAIAILLPDGNWQAGWFLWSGRRSDTPQIVVHAGTLDDGAAIALAIRPDAVLRWQDR